MKLFKRFVSVILVLFVAISPAFFSSVVENQLQGQIINSTENSIKTNLPFSTVEKVLSLDVKFVEKFENYTVFYCDCPYFKKFATVNKTQINCQISVKNGVVTIGLPIITGGF
ncbi:MAG: hypothetical protein RR107_04335 [Clostridia bacterium]